MGLINSTKEHISSNLIKNRIKDVDTICSSYIDFSNPRIVDIDGEFFSSILIINYQREMDKIFLDKILSLDVDAQISMFYNKQSSQEVIKELTYNIGNTGATIKTTNENQQDIEVVGSTYGDAKYIRKQLQLGDEDLFYLTIYIGIYAKTKEKLERDLERIESVAISTGLTAIRGNFRQEQALKSILPMAYEDEETSSILSRNVLTSGLVATYPFVSNELFDKDGILIGTNSFDNSLIMLDRFDTFKYKNANMFVVGTSGSGKSYFIKLMINRNRLLDIPQFIVDPDREYTKICEKLGGSLINFGTNQTINIFDIRNIKLEEGESYLRNKISKLNTFFSMIFENMNEEEKSSLEETFIKLYKEKDITEENSSLFVGDENSKLLQKKKFKTSQMMPKMDDLFNALKKDKKLKKYATILKPCISGSLSFLNNYTNIDINNKLVIADIHDVSEKELPIVMYIVTDYFWDVIKENRSTKKILYLDEVWKMINKNEYTADFVFKLFKTIRKFGGAATAITQDISDFFMLEDGKYGKGILNNSAVKCIFQLEESDIDILEKVVNISEEEKYRLINLKRGTTIMHAGRNTLMIDVIASEKEHEYITTDYITNNDI